MNRNPYKDAISQVRFSEEFEKLSVERMKVCIQKVMKDDKYKKNAQVFATMSKELNAKEKVAEILSEYAMRLHRY